jgi:hypothetical protein
VDISEKRWINNIIALTREYPNVYVDISNLNIFDDKIKGRLWRMLDLINECTNCPKSKECRQSYAHLKYKLIFGSDWYHTYFAKMKDGEKYMKDEYTYNEYCYQFERLFGRIDNELKLPAVEFWEHISLINPWRFYGFSNISEGKNKIQEMHDTLQEIYGTDPIYTYEKKEATSRQTALSKLGNRINRIYKTNNRNENTHKSYALDECIHEKSKTIRNGFGIDFYTEVKKLLKDNLAENEDKDKNTAFRLFERMESELRVGRIDYIYDYIVKSDSYAVAGGLELKKHYTAGIYDVYKKRFHVNIEKDREGLEKYGNNDKYSITVHEMWHNIDYLAQQKIRSIHRCDVDTSYQCTLKDSADCFKTKARVFTHCKECSLYGHSQKGNGNCPLFLSGNDDCPEVKDKFQPFSYFYQCNLLGDAIKQDVERDGREKLYTDVIERYIDILKNTINKDGKNKNVNLSSELNYRNALFHVFDILVGESYVYSYNNHYGDGILNESYLFRPNERLKTTIDKRMKASIGEKSKSSIGKELKSCVYEELKRNLDEKLGERPENYWIEEDRGKSLATEYFANIGSLSGTNSAAFKELLKYFPKSHKVYNEIIKYIFYYLPHDNLMKGRLDIK